MAITLTVSSTLGSIGAGTYQVTPFSTIGVIQTQVLGPNIASGFNQVSVPAGCVGFVFSPPATNTQTLTLKGVTGDTGIPMPISTPFVYLFGPTPPATFGITAGNTVGVCELVFF